MAEARVETAFFILTKALLLLWMVPSAKGQTITVLLDAYSLTSTLTDNPSTLPLGATVILTCRTAGIPQGTDYSYTWSCPGGSSCNAGQGRNPNRKTYEDRLVLHILSTADTGTYTCSVGLATGELLGMDQFEVIVEGGLVLHHGSNLIANNELITDVQDITSDGMASISCTTSHQQQPQWRGANGEITSTDTSLPLYVVPSSNPAILVINSNNINNFTNAEFTCNTTQYTASVNLYFGPGGTLQTPSITGGYIGTHIFIIVPTVQADRLIFGYERQDFNLPLQVEYQEVEGVPSGTGIVKPVSVPGVTYKLLLWAIEGNQYSDQPGIALASLRTGEAPSAPRSLTVTRTFTGGLELNWIPPKELNAGNIRYDIQYGLNTSDYTTVDTGGSDTYYNLTGLQQSTTYYIRVVAVNYVTASGVARTEGEWITVTVMASTQATTATPGIEATSITIEPSTTTITVLLDAYSLTSTLTDNPSTLPLGTTVILTCRTAGIAQGTDYNYTWSCPGGSSCNIGQGRNPNRKTYEDRLVLHILSFADTGTYTCSVGLATGELLGMDQFEIVVEGGLVLHHGSNLITNNELITDVQDITSDGMTSISCTTTDQQQLQWRGPNGEITSTDTSLPLYVVPSSNTAILIINSNNINNFTNAEFTCNTTQHTASVNLYFGPGGTLRSPSITGGSNGTHQFIIVPTVQADRFIFGYERQDLNLPLQVEYQEVEGLQSGTAIVKPASVPGVMYRILLWTVEGNQYSGQLVTASTSLQIGLAPSAPRYLTVTTSRLELNWIPPKEPNAGIIRYEIQYGLNTSDYTTVDTGRSDTYYNLTGLQSTTYYIRVVAVNYVTVSGVARTEGEWIAATVMASTQATTATPGSEATRITVEPSTTSSPGVLTGVTAGVAVAVLTASVLTATLLVLVVGSAVRRRHRLTKPQPQPAYSTAEGRLYDTVYDPADVKEEDSNNTKSSTTGAIYDYIDTAHAQAPPHTEPRPTTDTQTPVYTNTGGGLTGDTPTSALYQAIPDSPLQEGTSSQSQHYQPLQSNTDGDHTHTCTALSRGSERAAQKEEMGPEGAGSLEDETPPLHPSLEESSGHYTALQSSTMDSSHHYQRPDLAHSQH